MSDLYDMNNEVNNEMEQQDVQTSGKARKMKNRRRSHTLTKRLGKSAASGLAFGLAAAICFSGVTSLTGSKTSTTTTTASSVSSGSVISTSAKTDSSEDTTAATSSDGTMTVSEIADKCLSSVVAIECNSVEEVQSYFGTQSYEATSAGSGIIVGESDTELLIATNNHVVEGAQELSVCFNDDSDEVVSANIKGTDPDNDLAVVAVSLDDLSDDILNSITIATLGDSDSLEVGEQVVAIGNALGYGQSVTSGYISALNRDVTTSDETTGEETTTTLLQTDAAINPGNSGGALFNMKGEVIGINSAKYSSTEVEGMGFAIPISTAKDIIDSLSTKETKTVVAEDERGALGITCRNVSSEVASMYNMPEGIYVYETAENSAAAEAGIKSGDIITAIDGTTVTSTTELQNQLQYYKAGDTVTVTISRGSNGQYETQDLEVTLGEQTTTSTYGSTADNGSTAGNGATQTNPQPTSWR